MNRLLGQVAHVGVAATDGRAPALYWKHPLAMKKTSGNRVMMGVVPHPMMNGDAWEEEDELDAEDSEIAQDTDDMLVPLSEENADDDLPILSEEGAESLFDELDTDADESDLEDESAVDDDQL